MMLNIKYKGRVYLSGPISGMDPERVKSAFMRACRLLESMSDVEIVTPLKNGLPPTASWEQHMDVDLALLKACDNICLLPGWETSRGCRKEVHYAIEQGINIVVMPPNFMVEP